MDVDSQVISTCQVKQRIIMQRNIKKFIFTFNTAILCLTLSFAGFAQSKKETKKITKPFSGNIQFGYSAQSGNSRDKNITGELNLKYLIHKWEFLGHTDGQFMTTKTGTSSQNLTVRGESAYYFEKNHFAFGNVNYKYDKFSPYLYVLYGVVGYGWRPINTDKFVLFLQAGPGYRHQKTADTNKVENGVIIYGAGEFTWNITKNTAFKQRLSVDSGSKNTYAESKTSVYTTIIGNLGMEASFTVKHNTTIPTGSKNRYKTDTLTKLMLVYKW